MTLRLEWCAFDKFAAVFAAFEWRLIVFRLTLLHFVDDDAAMLDSVYHDSNPAFVGVLSHRLLLQHSYCRLDRRAAVEFLRHFHGFATALMPLQSAVAWSWVQ